MRISHATTAASAPAASAHASPASSWNADRLAVAREGQGLTTGWQLLSLPVVALPRYEGLVTGDAVKSFMKVVEKEVMALMMDGMGEAHDEM